MYANGFLQEQRRSPVSLAAVVGLHATAFALLVLYGTTTFHRQEPGVITVIPVRPEPPVPPENEPPPPEPQARQQPSRPTVVPTPIPTPGPVAGPPTPPREYEPPANPGPPTRYAAATVAPIPTPIRVAAEVDPRFRAALQPPYPPDRERAQDEGQVRVRITIGMDGRVTAIERVGGNAHDSFWRNTQRQALSRWRFRPATVDGRPIVSTMVFTVTFRLPEA